MKKNKVAFLFIAASILTLLVGLLFGVIGGLQYILPGLLKETLSFNKTRPIHVSLVITWIFSCAIGGIYYYLPEIQRKVLYSIRLATIQFIVFIVTGITIITCYFLGYFGGREYLEFPPILALPMLFTWILFMINFFKTINYKITEWPIYYWMWSTGLIFFLITFAEAYLWTLPFFGNQVVRDVTIQWKAMGSMVGSWNMLVYGTAFYIMEQISDDKKISKSGITFFFYFLGLTNLMFNWGHHTYIVPAAGWIKNVSYIISMTELLILGNIIRNWKKSVSATKKYFHLIPYRFLSIADIWIFLNLILAIIISIPGINFYTHGTHITVAHAMGATIGINTMILLASVYFIVENNLSKDHSTYVKKGIWLTNISLLIFWISLIGSGIVKAIEKENNMVFQSIMQNLSPWFHAFTMAGVGIFAGIFMISFPVIAYIYKYFFSTNKLLLKESEI